MVFVFTLVLIFRIKFADTQIYTHTLSQAHIRIYIRTRVHFFIWPDSYTRINIL